MTKKALFLLAFGTLVLFTFLGWVIMEYFGPEPLLIALQKGLSLPLQIVWGLILGVLVGMLAWALINMPFLRSTKDFFVQIIGPWRLNWLEIFLVSCSAGIGEEIFFRGAIQPHLGILWTSALFVLLHGYINPFNAPMSTYGLFMILAIYLLGWAAVQFGLPVAIVAHTVIDIVLLYLLSRAYDSTAEDISVDRDYQN